ncbi:MAG: hypothetical protein II458_08130 [Oscillospiraceae bacterium]|nr:hypothetical protein [Oscillospiraceae bacterium]
MKKAIVPLLLVCTMLLSGCGSFLNREYGITEPHSAAFFGSEDKSVLRIESYQDLVSALLMLVSDRVSEATVWFYPNPETPSAADAMSRACNEVRQDTPLGAFAVDYLSYTVDSSSHNYSVLRLNIGYRRTAEQVGAIVHATGVSALYDLLNAAADRGAEAVAVQVASFGQTQDEIRDAVAAIQLERYLADHLPVEPEEPEPTEDPEEPPIPEDPAEEPGTGEEEEPSLPADVTPWQVYFYPAEGTSGIVEVLLGGE